jgi:DNA-binding PadR family transcriptional regulator
MTSTDLDLFILALVQAGLATTYDLKSKAGLSVGSTAPVLARLEEAGLIGAPKAGVRGTRPFSVTKAGSKHLNSEWRSLLGRQPTDVDEILRITYIAWVLGSPDEASRVLVSTSSELSALAATRRAEANQLQRSLMGQVGGQAFRWLRTSAEAARIQAQSMALKHLAEEIRTASKKKNESLR